MAIICKLSERDFSVSKSDRDGSDRGCCVASSTSGYSLGCSNYLQYVTECEKKSVQSPGKYRLFLVAVSMQSYFYSSVTELLDS